MEKSEIDTLLHDIEELRRAVRRNNPFLRQVLASRLYSAYTIVFGLLVIAFCVASQVLVARWGSFAAIPSTWRTAFLVAAGLVFLAGGGIKWILFNRRAGMIDRNANYLTVIRAFFAASWFHVNIPAYICAVAGPVFAISVGHPWYSVPACAAFLAILFNNVGVSIQRRDYLIAGWYALASGLASLAFIERAPFVWTAVVVGGFCLAFGLGGFLVRESEAQR
jgi:hypothetical protein